MKWISKVLLVSLIFVVDGTSVLAKQRLFVLTDIENEPDDAQSLVRLLSYANHFDIEGLVATTSIHQRTQTAAWRIREIVEAYRKVQPNLVLHEPGFPAADALLSVLREGRPDYISEFTMNEAKQEYKVGDIVIALKGPHKGDKHEVIHCFDDVAHYSSS